GPPSACFPGYTLEIGPGYQAWITPKSDEILRRDSGFRNISPAGPPETLIFPPRRLFQKPECFPPGTSLSVDKSFYGQKAFMDKSFYGQKLLWTKSFSRWTAFILFANCVPLNTAS